MKAGVVPVREREEEEEKGKEGRRESSSSSTTGELRPAALTEKVVVIESSPKLGSVPITDPTLLYIFQGKSLVDIHLLFLLSSPLSNDNDNVNKLERESGLI